MLTKEQILANINNNIGQTFAYPAWNVLRPFKIKKVYNKDHHTHISFVYQTKDKKELEKDITLSIIYEAYEHFYKTGEFKEEKDKKDKNGIRKLVNSLISDDRIAPKYIYINSYTVKIKRAEDGVDKNGKKKYKEEYDGLKQAINKNGEECPIILCDSLESYSFPDIFAPSPLLNGKYQVNKNIIKIDFKYCPLSVRQYIYKNGVYVDGIKYVRYKRTASASRHGTCLFIQEKLFKNLNKWSESILSLDIEDNKKNEEFVNKLSLNYSSFESYKALTLSTIDNIFLYNPKNILVIKDEEQPANNETVIRVVNKEAAEKLPTYISLKNDNTQYEKELLECDDLVAFIDNVDIRNKIWDGQGLADVSLFEDKERFVFRPHGSAPYKDGHGMMFVRNRFFKSCLFNTKLQKYLKEEILEKHGLMLEDKVSEHKDILNGVTLAKTFKDIKIVVTYSSLKFLKFFKEKDYEKVIKKWMNSVGKEKDNTPFAVTKVDKNTSYRLNDKSAVRTSYQLLNTLCFKKDKPHVRDAFKDYLDLLFYARNDLSNFKQLLKSVSPNRKEFTHSYNLSLRTCKQLAVERLLDCNDIFYSQRAFKETADKLIDDLFKRAKEGKLLVNGRSATLFGNPFEFLRAIERGTTFEQDIHEHEAYSPQFDRVVRSGDTNDKANLMIIRSPHIMMGNIYIAKNVENKNISTWFNNLDNIICINSAGENVLNRLNGSDFDSDFALVTDNNTLIELSRNDETQTFAKYSVPHNDIQTNGLVPLLDKDYKPNYNKIAEVDSKLAHNNIGKIVDTSQKINSLIWYLFRKHGNDRSYLWKPYFMDSVLEVLSNVEIDAAKHESIINSSKVLLSINEQLGKILDNEGLGFFNEEKMVEQKNEDTEAITQMKPPSYFKAKQGRENYKDKAEFYLFFGDKKTAKKLAETVDLSGVDIPNLDSTIKNAKYYFNKNKEKGCYKLPNLATSLRCFDFDLETGVASVAINLKITNGKRKFEVVDNINPSAEKKELSALKEKLPDGEYHIPVYVIYYYKDFTNYYYDYGSPMDIIYKEIKEIASYNPQLPEFGEHNIKTEKLNITNYIGEVNTSNLSDGVKSFLGDVYKLYKRVSDGRDDGNDTVYLNDDINQIIYNHVKTLNDEDSVKSIIGAMVKGYKSVDINIAPCSAGFSNMNNLHFLILYIITSIGDSNDKDQQVYRIIFSKK